ncbi:MAG: Rubrerythrin [Acidobacteria bacterium ADurb.Bin340]|nr:MAG: Rubrerythrin [Acidobacteria bacterium ADurb.Bin340]
MLLQEALSAAITYEHRVRDHYADCAQKATDAKGQRIFAIMAREEQGHVEYLESRMAEWKATGEVKAAELTSILPSPGWLEQEARKLTQGAGKASQVLPEMEFLKEALELERRTSAFYRQLVGALDPKYRPLFERFLEIEEGHVTLVQAEIDALAGHGHWFDFMEFSLEK